MTPQKPCPFLFVGSVMPPDMCQREPAGAFSGNKAQINMIRALASALGSNPQVVSFKSVGMFPRTHRIVIRPEAGTIGDGLGVRLVPFFNIFVLKQVSISIMVLLALVKWLRKTKSRDRIVFVYNIYLPLSAAVISATKILGCRSIAIVADVPHNLNMDFRGPGGWLRKANFALETMFLPRFSGLIPLTKQISRDFAPGTPSLVVEGGVNADDAGDDSDSGTRRPGAPPFLCLYSGAVNRINGVDLLLSAFRLIESPEYRLAIFGRGELEGAVREAARRDGRILSGGAIPNEQVLRRQREATVLINPRPSHRLITRYTFPSKLLEYMLSGRPVITTVLPGIPGEYYEYVYPLTEETPEGLARRIRAVCSRPASELTEFGTRARRFILREKNWDMQAQRIRRFVEGL